MKEFLRIPLCFISVVTVLVHVVQGTRKKPDGHATVRPKIGWKYGKGPCMCTGAVKPTTPGRSHPSRPHPSGPHPRPSMPLSLRPHPSRPHPSWPHSLGPHPSWPLHSRPHPSGPHPHPYAMSHSIRPHPWRPHPSRPHPHPSRPHSFGPLPWRPHPSRPHPHPSRPHSFGPLPWRPHPSRPHPHPSRPHSFGPLPWRPHPSGPHPLPSAMSHSMRPHPWRPHPSRPHPHSLGPHPSGRHSPKNLYTPCICRKRAEKIAKIELRMLKEWKPEFADRSTEAFKRMYGIFVEGISKVLQLRKEDIKNVNFTKGSIVARFEVVYTSQSSGNGSKNTEDPEKALRNAIQSGQLAELKIEPGSLVVSQSFSGVNLTSWTTKLNECSSKCHDDKYSSNVQQTRECAEVTASCDDVPLTRETSCDEACPKYSNAHASRKQVYIIVGILIVAVVAVVSVVVIFKFKRDRRKQISTSPSIGSMKQLTENDKLQSRC